MMNYNDPIEVVEVFRVLNTPRNNSEDDYPEDLQHILSKTQTKEGFDAKEYSHKHCFGWEEIRSIRQYGMQDDWKTYKGDKYFIKLSSSNEEILVLGSYQDMIKHWTGFRNAYPLFR